MPNCLFKPPPPIPMSENPFLILHNQESAHAHSKRKDWVQAPPVYSSHPPHPDSRGSALGKGKSLCSQEGTSDFSGPTPDTVHSTQKWKEGLSSVGQESCPAGHQLQHSAPPLGNTIESILWAEVWVSQPRSCEHGRADPNYLSVMWSHGWG